MPPRRRRCARRRPDLVNFHQVGVLGPQWVMPTLQTPNPRPIRETKHVPLAPFNIDNIFNICLCKLKQKLFNFKHVIKMNYLTMSIESWFWQWKMWNNWWSSEKKRPFLYYFQTSCVSNPCYHSNIYNTPCSKITIVEQSAIIFASFAGATVHV